MKVGPGGAKPNVLVTVDDKVEHVSTLFNSLIDIASTQAVTKKE